MNLKDGVPVVKNRSENSIRLIKFNAKIPKEKWYSELAGQVMKVYLYGGHKNAVAVSNTDWSEIDGDHFTLVKYQDKLRNNDLRLEKPTLIVR